MSYFVVCFNNFHRNKGAIKFLPNSKNPIQKTQFKPKRLIARNFFEFCEINFSPNSKNPIEKIQFKSQLKIKILI